MKPDILSTIHELRQVRAKVDDAIDALEGIRDKLDEVTDSAEEDDVTGVTFADMLRAVFAESTDPMDRLMAMSRISIKFDIPVSRLQAKAMAEIDALVAGGELAKVDDKLRGGKFKATDRLVRPDVSTLSEVRELHLKVRGEVDKELSKKNED